MRSRAMLEMCMYINSEHARRFSAICSRGNVLDLQQYLSPVYKSAAKFRPKVDPSSKSHLAHVPAGAEFPSRDDKSSAVLCGMI